MNPKKITFKSSNGLNLAGHLYLPVDGRPSFYAVFAHCFTCTKNFKAVSRICRSLSDEGIAVLSFDFTGLGNSEGEFESSTFSSNMSDLSDAVQFLKEAYEAPSLLIGHSLGGAAALYAVSGLPSITALVTIGAPADPAHVTHLLDGDMDRIRREGKARVRIGGRPFTISKEFVEDLNQEPINDFLKSSRKSLLVLHSPQDEIVGIENAQKIFSAAFHPKSFVSLDGADHLVSDEADARYIGQLIATWSSRYVAMLPFQKNETKGHPVFVRLSGKTGYQTEIKTPYHHLLADEPEEVGGDNSGPTPYDLLMASLGSCTAMTIQMYSRRKKWDLDEVRVFLDHHKVHREDSAHSEKTESKVSQFTRKISLDGDLDADQRQRLLEIANRCPVHRTLEEDILVHTELISP